MNKLITRQDACEKIAKIIAKDIKTALKNGDKSFSQSVYGNFTTWSCNGQPSRTGWKSPTVDFEPTDREELAAMSYRITNRVKELVKLPKGADWVSKEDSFYVSGHSWWSSGRDVSFVKSVRYIKACKEFASIQKRIRNSPAQR